VISPAGTGLVYSGTTARLSYALGRNGYAPPALARVDTRGVPFVSLIFGFVVGMLVFLPFPSWAGLVSLVTSATVMMYAMAPVSLAALRRNDPDRPRAYRLPAAKVLAPLSFVCANFIVYWAGWNTIFWLYLFIILGYVVFFAYQWSCPPERKLHLEWRAAAWIPPWLIGLGIISYLGQFPSSAPSSGWPFGITLLARLTIPFWWDLVIIAVFSLAIFYLAVHLAQPQEYVTQAVAASEDEMGLDDVAQAGTIAP
jgi:amino acid transporter